MMKRVLKRTRTASDMAGLETAARLVKSRSTTSRGGRTATSNRAPGANGGVEVLGKGCWPLGGRGDAPPPEGGNGVELLERDGG